MRAFPERQWGLLCVKLFRGRRGFETDGVFRTHSEFNQCLAYIFSNFQAVDTETRAQVDNGRIGGVGWGWS
eukprot:1329879-Amorphochlora_amoeboformis.AAC.1